MVPEKIRKLKQSVDKLEDNRVKLPLKEKKTVIQKVPISSAVETDSLVAKSSKRLKKTDTESITISIQSPLIKPKKGPKTVIGKNIEMSL